MNDVELASKRKRNLKCPELDSVLFQWVEECNRKQIPINYEIIKNKGVEPNLIFKIPQLSQPVGFRNSANAIHSKRLIYTEKEDQ